MNTSNLGEIEHHDVAMRAFDILSKQNETKLIASIWAIFGSAFLWAYTNSLIEMILLISASWIYGGSLIQSAKKQARLVSDILEWRKWETLYEQEINEIIERLRWSHSTIIELIAKIPPLKPIRSFQEL